MIPMNKIPETILILPLLSALLLAGCGGGSVFAEGGIGGTGISTGTVTGIGSITVNGVKFDTDNAAIYVEGVRVDDQCVVAVDAEDCLRNILGFSEGQVVRVVGDFNADGKSGTADAIYYNDSIEGPVDSASQIDASTQGLVVMGQLVIVDSQTKPDGVNLATFDPDDIVEVSGLRDDQGRIHAGYLKKTGTFPIEDAVEIKGIIDSVDEPALTFTINGLTVDYSSVIPSPSLQPGMQVEVKGTYSGTQINADRKSVV